MLVTSHCCTKVAANSDYYRPRSEASEGYVFTAVCYSLFNYGGGGSALLAGGGLPSCQGRPPPPCHGRPPPPAKADPPSPGNMTVNRRAVRILLECILVRECEQFVNPISCSHNFEFISTGMHRR